LETTLILARHAATAANRRRPPLLQGACHDNELDELGQRQAEALAEALRGDAVAAVYSSPLKRARQTAACVAADHGLEVRPLDALIEADVGSWEGLSWQEIERRWPEERRAFLQDAERFGYLDGENLIQVRDRCLSAILDVAGRHEGGRLVAVGHNVVNRVLLAHWMDIPLKHARRIPQSNAGFNVVAFSDGKVKVRTINSASHLAGLTPGH
jgi:alpha-ribazole phosphatase